MVRFGTFSVAALLAVGLTSCSDSFVGTYALNCGAPVAVGGSGTITLTYTSFEPISVAWMVDPATAGAFPEIETAAPATNEDEPQALTTMFEGLEAGAHKVSTVVNGVETSSCTVVVDPNVVPDVTLTVAVTGSGQVTGAAGGIDCPGDCTEDLAPASQVRLTATPAMGFVVDSVDGPCTEAGPGLYDVTLEADVTCTFTFGEEPAPPNTVTVPAGPFTRGCQGCPSDTPLGTVTLSQPFDIDIFEVTVAQYRACVDAQVCTEPPTDEPGQAFPCVYHQAGLDDHPVNCVSWQQAKSYCEWRGQDLPTEAQWERAARGAADERRYPWGEDDATCALANVILVPFERCVSGTSTVGAHPTGSSPDGVQDMIGNVAEWVSDWFSPTYYDEATSQVDPMGPASSPGNTRVIRGGSFRTIATQAFVYDRTQHSEPTRQDPEIGFRCVKN